MVEMKQLYGFQRNELKLKLPALKGPVAGVIPSKQHPKVEDSHFGRFFFFFLHCLGFSSVRIITSSGFVAVENSEMRHERFEIRFGEFTTASLLPVDDREYTW